jgi:hypothetical protein
MASYSDHKPTQTYFLNKAKDAQQTLALKAQHAAKGNDWVVGVDTIPCERLVSLGRMLVAYGSPPKFDLVDHLDRQRRFSEKTFGPGARTKGVVDHIRKELGEIEADPTDVMEWVDVIILAFDGAWRAGWKPAEIVEAIVAKQTRNEARDWPDWRTADPDKAIEHVRKPTSEGDRFVGMTVGEVAEQQAREA